MLAVRHLKKEQILGTDYSAFKEKEDFEDWLFNIKEKEDFGDWLFGINGKEDFWRLAVRH
jgi:hypothetical protein